MTIKRRDVAVLVVEVAGALLIVAGLWLWLVPLALVVGGALCIAFALAWERSTPNAG